MELVKVEVWRTVRTPFYQTDSTGGSVWVIKPGQILPKHYHHHSDDYMGYIARQGCILSNA